MGEFKVHRVRFFDYMPSGIRAIAYNRDTKRIAVARIDGSIEISNVSDNLFQEKVIPGKEEQSIESLCWVGDRLFSVGLSGEIVELDLHRLRPKTVIDAYGGPIWTIAANPQGTHVAVGCEDGTVKLFEILEDGIQFERNLDRKKGRVLSLSWHPSGTKIAAGMMDMIRVFDVHTGRAVHRLLVDKTVGARRDQECIVWSVVYLSDNTLISGDSAGNVKVWDTLTGTLIKNHDVTKWDVLSLSVSMDESSVVAGTSEGTVVHFQFLSRALSQQEDMQWVRTKTFKNHTHDVRAVVEADSAVISGGMDTLLVMRPLLEKHEERTRAGALRILHFPHRRLVSCAKKAQLLLFQYPSHLELWRLGESKGNGAPGTVLPVQRNPEKLLQLKTKGEEHIHCSAVSPCGEWLAYSSTSCLRLFRLQYDNNNISISKVSSLPKVLRCAHQLCFSSDSSHLFAASPRSAVHVVSLNPDGCKHRHTFKAKAGSPHPIHLLTVSEDGQWLATANSESEVNVYNLSTFKSHCTAPAYRSGVSAMAIHPTTNNLFIAYADQQIFEFSIDQICYTDWSRKLHRQGLHPKWLERDTPITNVTFNPQNPSHVILHDMYMFCVLDQSAPLPDMKSQFYYQLTLKSLPEQERRKFCHAFKVCKLFQPLMCVDMMGDQSLVVVERSLLDITAALPAPVKQKKFAT